jgi:hypothetical protein
MLLSAAVVAGVQVAAILAQQSVRAPNPATDWPMFKSRLGCDSLFTAQANQCGKCEQPEARLEYALSG